MTKNIATFLSVIAVFLCFSVPTSFAGNRTPPLEAISAAEEGLPILQKIMGWKKALRGECFEVGIVTDSKLREDDQGQDLSSISVPIKNWMCLLGGDESVKSILVVRHNGTKWVPELENDPMRAANMLLVTKAWPRSEGYDYRILSASSLDIRLMEVSHGHSILGYLRLYPKEAAPYLKEEFDPTRLRDPKEIASEIQTLAKKFTSNRGGR